MPTPLTPLQKARDFALRHPKAFNEELDKIAPDEYRGTRKLAKALILKYPERFKDATPDQLVDMVDKIGQVESRMQNIAQRSYDPKKKKFFDGPGRGFFQIEVNSAPTYLKTYSNYRNNYLKDLNAVPLPDIKLPANNDVRALTKDEQASLTLSKISARAGKNVINPVNARDMWINYHWAGNEDQKAERIKHWDDVFAEKNETKPVEKRKQLLGQLK